MKRTDIDKCYTAGKLTIKGVFSNDIKEKLIFDLHLAYPNVKIHCELNKLSGNGLKTSILKYIKSLTIIISIENA